MILTIKGADFSSANIGTLSTYIISKSIGSGATFDIPNFVDKNSSVNWVITLDEDYTFGTYSVTMGGEVITPTVVDNVMTISIAEVTGNVRIIIATVNTNTGEEEGGEEPENPTPEESIPDNEWIDITSTIAFNKPLNAYQVANGLIKTSTYFDSTDLIDISNYDINAVNLSCVKYTDSANNQCGFGVVMYDANQNMINNYAFEKYTEYGPKGTYEDTKLIIPSNTKYIVFSKFNDNATSNNVFEGDNTFYVKIAKITNTEIDITNLFDFDNKGYTQHTKTSTQWGDYQIKYWNSDRVDISQYAGERILISTPIWNTSQNIQGPYGFLTETEDGILTPLHTFNHLTGITGLGGSVETLEFVLPTNAKYLRVCYYSTEMKNATNPVSDEVLNGFFCKVIKTEI